MKSPNSTRLALALVTAFAQTLLTLSSVQAQPAALCPECKATAGLTLQSALMQIQSDYYRAKAKANTFTDGARRTGLTDAALQSYRSGFKLSRDQYEARLLLCSSMNECRYDPVINPANFLKASEIPTHPNPYWPMVPGTTYHYKATSPDGSVETVEVEFTHETRTILGIECIVVRDRVLADGEISEQTTDYYAQDRAGNVWYFGEITAEYVNGEIATLQGTWEAGKDGAKPGYQMKWTLKVGDVYRQELLIGEAEDVGEILGLNESITTAYATFKNCLKTKDTTPNTPAALEHKYYAPGVGFVFQLKPKTGERLELISIEKNP